MTNKVPLSTREQVYVPPRRTPELVRVPDLGFVMIDGRGDPNTAQAYQDAVAALYSLSYTLKFAIKKNENLAYKVGPLEGLWWADDMSRFSVERKSEWAWTMMIGQPEAVTTELYAWALAKVARKKPLPDLDLARYARFEEGLCAQVLHVGPFSAEGPTIAGLHDFIRERELKLAGVHHEIYLSDIRRAAPDKWRTIIRQPVDG